MAVPNQSKNTTRHKGPVKQPGAHHGLNREQLAEARRRMDALIEKETGYVADPEMAAAWGRFASQNYRLCNWARLVVFRSLYYPSGDYCVK